jgi:hypothetical protein
VYIISKDRIKRLEKGRRKREERERRKREKKEREERARRKREKKERRNHRECSYWKIFNEVFLSYFLRCHGEGKEASPALRPNYKRKRKDRRRGVDDQIYLLFVISYLRL